MVSWSRVWLADSKGASLSFTADPGKVIEPHNLGPERPLEDLRVETGDKRDARQQQFCVQDLNLTL